MSKIQSDGRTSFFPNSNSVNPAVKKSTSIFSLPPRNDKERQNEIKLKTENDAQVKIPEQIKDFARIKRAVDQAPEIDNTEKISKIKEMINNGSYEIDYDALAEKVLLNEF